MINVTDILKEKYYSLLAPVVGVPVFQHYVPSDLNTDAYVLISSVNTNDASTMTSPDTENTVQLGIYTRTTTDNSGLVKKAIADIIYATISPQITISLLPDAQCLSTELVGDNDAEAFITPEYIFLNRFITYRHKIFHFQ